MKITSKPHPHQEGFALVLALTLLAVMTLMVLTYSIVTVNNLRVNKNSTNTNMGIFPAEGGMNARAERIRQKFVGFRVPEGSGPLRGTTTVPCTADNLGDKDMACETLNLSGRTVQTYVNQGTTRTYTLGAGEDFSGLSVIETPFTVYGQALNDQNNPEAITSLTFKSRLVPLFQFAVFFDKDLEFDNTASLNLTGPVHTNGNLFLDGKLTINGNTSKVSAAGEIYRGHKQDSRCDDTPKVGDASNTLKSVDMTCRTAISSDTLKSTWGIKMRRAIDPLTVPTVADLQPVVGNSYWDRADARILLKQVASNAATDASWQVSLVNADKTTLVSLANSATGPCNYGYQTDPSGTIGMGRMLSVHRNFRDNREGAARRMVDVDVKKLLTCLHIKRTTLDLGGATVDTDDNDINDKSDDGLVVYMTVDDSNYAKKAQAPTSGAFIKNDYGFRLINGDELKADDARAPAIRGLTFVSDQAVYLLGDYNTPDLKADGWKPASIVADSFNMISKGWTTSSTCKLDDTGGDNRFASKTNHSSRPTSLGTRVIGTQSWYLYSSSTTTAPRGDTYINDAKSSAPLFCRPATSTTFHAAVLAGTATTGDAEGILGTNASPLDPSSGGVHNMMRFHEEWGHPAIFSTTSAQTFNYSGSLVSLSKPLHANGAFRLGGPGVVTSRGQVYFSSYPLRASSPYTFDADLGTYTPPTRNWKFDEQFLTAENLPPLTPRFVYIKQENFTRQFSQ